MISLGELVEPFPNIFLTFPGPMISFTVKENHIGTAVSKILWYMYTCILCH